MSIAIPLPRKGENAVDLWHQALEQALCQNDFEIVFAGGRYDFYPEHCSQRYCYFSNNDEGIKTIAADLQKIDALHILGHNTEWFFHGRISPLVAQECSDLTIEGISIDFEDSFVSDADVVEQQGDISWLKISGKHSFANGKLHFTGDFYDNLSGQLLFYSYNKEKKELVWNNKIARIPNENLFERNGLIGIPGLKEKVLSDALVIKHEARLCPGMVFDRCKGITLRNVTLHHAAGMGILAQLSSDIQLENVQIVPRGRRASVSDDAVHFSECRGQLSLDRCILTGTLDDSFNAHGIYRPLKMRIPGGKFYYLDSGHFQQQGLQGAFPGDTLELMKNDTGRPYAQIKLRNARTVNKSLTLIEPEREMPPEWAPGDDARVVETASAELTITNCTFHPLNGRGVLATGVKKARIAGNTFHTSGAAVFVSGDGNYWYESGPVEEMVIENNCFDNCCFSQNSSTREIVAVFPELQKLPEDFFYHGSVTVKDNTFVSNKRPQISMLSVRNAELCGNRFLLDTAYPFEPAKSAGYSFAVPGSPWAIFKHCGKVEEKQNSGFEII